MKLTTDPVSDALIVGGGIVGLTTALELRQRGLAVTLLEKSQLGSGASGAAGGILSPLRPWQSNNSLARLCKLSLSCYDNLFEKLRYHGISIAPTVSGLLCVMPGETKTAAIWAKNQEWKFRTLSPATLAREEPAIKADAGFLLPEVAQVEARSLLDALAQAARREDVQIHEGCEVHTITLEKNLVVNVMTTGGPFAAHAFILCAGAWVTSLLPETFARPDIRPVRGQMIEFAAVDGLLRHIVVHTVAHQEQNAATEHYLVPRPGGRILAGSTLEHCGFDNATTTTSRRQLAFSATQILPALARYPVAAQWAGLRPDASRSTPLICAHPQIDNLFINGGHFRNGIALAPASALLLAQLLCRTPPTMDTTAFRFKPAAAGV